MSARDEQVRRAEADLENAYGNLAWLRGQLMGLLMNGPIFEALVRGSATECTIEPDFEHGETVVIRGGVRYRIRVEREDGLVP